MKKIALFCMCALLLAACGGRDDPAPGAVTPEPPTAPPAAESAEALPAPPPETQEAQEPQETQENQDAPEDQEVLEDKEAQGEGAAPPPERVSEPSDSDLVLVRDWIPGIQVALKYATDDNFTGAVIYDFNGAYLRYGTVKKLLLVQQSLEELGYGLKIWDAYRPVYAQRILWEICPDPRFVSDPDRGSFSHGRGSAVDVTLVDAEGRELPMPTGFDDFSERADREYSDVDALAADNARLLETLMEECGMVPYWGEWWHFSDSVAYEVVAYDVPHD